MSVGGISSQGSPNLRPGGVGYPGAGPVPTDGMISTQGSPNLFPGGVGYPGSPSAPPWPGYSNSGAPPWAQGSQGGAGGGYGSSTQANPYLREAFEYYKQLLAQAQELYNKAPDKQGAIEDYERTRAQAMKELEAASARSGFGPGTGMSLAQKQNYLQGTMQGEQGLSTQLYNQGLQHQKDILGQLGQLALGMTGAGGSIAANQLGNRSQSLAESQFGFDSWLRSQLLPYQMQNLASNNQVSEAQALRDIAALV